MKYTVTGVWNCDGRDGDRLVIAGVLPGDASLVTACAAPCAANSYVALVEAGSAGQAEALALADVAGDVDDLLTRFGLDLGQAAPENRDSRRHQNWLRTLRQPEIGSFSRSVEDSVLPVHMSN